MIRDRVNTAAHRYQTHLTTLLNQSYIDSSSEYFTSRADPISGLPHFDATMGAQQMGLQRVIPLPMNSRPVSVPLAQSRDDLVGLKEDLMRSACTVMGVPFSYVRSGSIGYATDARSAANVLQSTLMRSKTDLSVILKDVYRVAFDPEARFTEMSELKNRSSPKHDVIRVVFPSMDEVETYAKLFQEGIVTGHTYRAVLASRHDLLESDFNVEMDTYNRTHVAEPKRKGEGNPEASPSGSPLSYPKRPRLDESLPSLQP